MGYAVVTGASGGIGLCLARELAARKYDLLLIARSEAKLVEACQQLASEFKVQANYLALDLSNRESIGDIKNWIEKNYANVEVLVNNAGYGIWGPFEQTEVAQLENMMQLNMNALVDLCHLIIPYLRKKQRTFILNIASTAAYQAVPTLATYAATKAFVVLFSRGLRWELSGSGISVSCLSPGTTSTGFISRAGLDSLKERAEKFSMKPETVAKTAITRMLKGDAEIVPGFLNWFSVKLTYFLPKSLIEKIAGGLYVK